MSRQRSWVGVLGWLSLTLFVSLAAAAEAADNPPQLARLRTFDVQHIKAELELNIKDEKVHGLVSHTIQPLHNGFQRVVLDCEQTEVKHVHVQHERQPFSVEGGKLIINLNAVYDRDDVFTVEIEYVSRPTRGMYFVKPDAVEPNKPITVWTQGEPEDTHFWLPCWDYPNDMATTEMIVRVPEELFVISNGRLVETTHDADALTKTYHWKMDQPHVSYLISLVVGDFKTYETEVDGLPIVSYAATEQFDPATMQRAYGRTPEMMRFFSRTIAVDYPWSKYSQVTVPDFRFGGMENISATTLYEFTLMDEPAAQERSMDGLIAHELAHQWWGNLLTCQDWSHLWLNEGFATYFDALFVEYDRGAEAFAYEMQGNRRGGIGADQPNPRPVVWTRYKRPIEMFDGHAYPKGACILHMLRGVLGREEFFNGLSLYARKHRHQTVETADLQAVLEESSGKDLDWFFEQWCYKAGSPELKISWRWSADDSTARVRVRQTHKTSDLVPLFKLPTELEFMTGTQRTRVPVIVDGADQEFIIRLPAKPELVYFDPDHFLLAEITFEKEPAELLRQLADGNYPLWRAEAAKALAARGETASTEEKTAWEAAISQARLTEAGKDLRADLTRSLGKLAGPQAEGLVVAALEDPHPAVRRAAVEALRPFEGEPVTLAVKRMWQRELAPAARAAALETLVKRKAPDWQALLTSSLEETSWRDEVAAAAVRLLAESEHPQRRELVHLKTFRGQPRQIRTAAVGALIKLAADDRQLVSRLGELTDDPSYFVRRAAVDGLGRVGGDAEASLLQTRLSMQPPRDPQEREQMEQALTKLRERLANDKKKAA